jgi:L-alanine-DL-glutamate epimerase-like enolase superfamily enzyme
MRIDRFEATLYRIALEAPVQMAGKPLLADFDMVVVEIGDADGATGWGYTALHSGHGAAVAALAAGPFAELLDGEDARHIEALWHRLWKSAYYSGRGGSAGFALAAIDTALWDLRAKSLGEPLWRLLGGFSARVPAYAGNIDLHLPLEALLDNASRTLESGHRALKMRLGKPTLAEDVARVTAMRKLVGAEVPLMVDANESFRVDQAVRACHALRDLDLGWIEEPITPDNFAGYAHVRAAGGIPVAAGENLHTLPEFAQLITAGGVDFPEPDLTVCGGITPWLKIAHLAEAHGLPVTSHGAHEMHVHLLAAVPNAAYLEVHAVGLDRFIAEPLVITDGHATAPDRPGHGIELDRDALAPYRLG